MKIAIFWDVMPITWQNISNVSGKALIPILPLPTTTSFFLSLNYSSALKMEARG
jgi:hypothetical protein